MAAAAARASTPPRSGAPRRLAETSHFTFPLGTRLQKCCRSRAASQLRLKDGPRLKKATGTKIYYLMVLSFKRLFTYVTHKQSQFDTAG